MSADETMEQRIVEYINEMSDEKFDAFISQDLDPIKVILKDEGDMSEILLSLPFFSTLTVNVKKLERD